MYKQDLNGAWLMKRTDGTQWLPARVPGSAYGDLLADGQMDDPFYRDNETTAFELMKHDYLYRRAFTADEALFNCDAVTLRCDGLDTLATLTLNGRELGRADNMHRAWRFPVKELLRHGENTLEIRFESPINAAAERYARNPVEGSSDATRGFPLIRKAHCMYGWDWGPRLPDCGIWRSISLEGVQTARIVSVLVRQEHGSEGVTLRLAPEIEAVAPGETHIRYALIDPDGVCAAFTGDSRTVRQPRLWWPRGLGGQPLYTLRAELIDTDGRTLDVWERRIGLRALTVKREKDKWGESFAFTANGVSFFCMGADYIPEDNLLGRVTPERTRRLLEDCVESNFNCVRVWGGGHYPSDEFYDICDELGLVVWQDFMFACAAYDLDVAFAENIAAELDDNIRRLRHHASLGLWCGNNEMEQFAAVGLWVNSPKLKADYIRLFEYLIPNRLRKLDPDTFFWPSSPSSGGGFDGPADPDRGDVHYWDVWHGGKPFTDYRNYFFRFASEFGFQSFPCDRTVESFTLPEDRNIFSRVMEKHQRNGSANGKILTYLSQTFLYPRSFSLLLYASQLMQAEAIRYGVEHWRRNRGRCMGAIYWQLNDCWPVASWASIDFFGRWKALQYEAKRFFAPVLLSCEETGPVDQLQNLNAELEKPLRVAARLNVSNERREPFVGTVRWALRAPDASVRRAGEQAVTVPALSALWLDEMALEELDPYATYLSYDLIENGAVVSHGSTLFCAPKHFRFLDPALSVERDGDALVVRASAYARQVEIACEDGDAWLEDNYFDMDAGERRVRILRGDGDRFSVRSVFDIR